MQTAITSRCACGCCQPMVTERESMCCQKLEEIVTLLVGDPVPACITQHLDFANACLNRAVLTIPYLGHCHHHGTSDIPADENMQIT